MVLTTIILWDLACDATTTCAIWRTVSRRTSGFNGSSSMEANASWWTRRTTRRCGTRCSRRAETPEAVGLNAAVRAAKGRNLVLFGQDPAGVDGDAPGTRDLPRGEPVGDRCRARGGWRHPRIPGAHLRGFSGCSSLPALFAGNGIVCARRSIFSAREAFSSNVPRSLVWSDLVFSHLAHGGKSSGSRIVRFWSNAAFLPGTEQDEIRPGHGPSPADWGCYVEAKDRIEFHLTRNLVERVLRGGLEPAEELDLLGRIEAIFQCCAELVPARRTCPI